MLVPRKFFKTKLLFVQESKDKLNDPESLNQSLSFYNPTPPPKKGIRIYATKVPLKEKHCVSKIPINPLGNPRNFDFQKYWEHQCRQKIPANGYRVFAYLASFAIKKNVQLYETYYANSMVSSMARDACTFTAALAERHKSRISKHIF